MVAYFFPKHDVSAELL